WIAVARFRLRWVPIGASRVVSELRGSAAVFLAQVSVHAYASANVVVLGVVAGTVAVAQYSVAEKIYSAARGLLSPIVQALFPGLASQFERSEIAFRAMAIRISLRVMVLLAVGAGVLILVADPLVVLVAGERDLGTVQTVKILCFSL